MEEAGADSGAACSRDRNRTAHVGVPTALLRALFVPQMNIRITDRALDRLRSVALSESIDLSSTMLRIAVVPGGCSGLTYDLGWDTTRKPDDQSLELGGMIVVLDTKSRLHADGSELDFTDGLEGQGFHFLNPQAARTCACGESFGL